MKYSECDRVTLSMLVIVISINIKYTEYLIANAKTEIHVTASHMQRCVYAQKE